MNLLKLLIPSWRFFDKQGDTVTLYCQVGDGAWEKCLKAPPRHLGNLFLNGKGNLYLLSQNLVERLAQDADQNIETKESFRLVKNLVEHRLSEKIMGGKFRFKLTIKPANGAPEFDLLTSAEYDL